MSLPQRVSAQDIDDVCKYLSNKPTGISLSAAKKVIDVSKLNDKKVAGYKALGILHNDSVLKLTDLGRDIAKGGERRESAIFSILKSVEAYNSILEKAYHKKEDSYSTADVGSYWHDNYPSEVASGDKTLNEQVVVLFQLAEAVELGSMIIGRRGSQTRLSFNIEKLGEYIGLIKPQDDSGDTQSQISNPENTSSIEKETESNLETQRHHEQLGNSIFIAHGKNKTPLEQLKKILDQFKIPYKVAIDEPNLGRPISSKVRDVLHQCNCAILIFSADEVFYAADKKEIWRPSENVVYELGASGYLYDNRIVILKEDNVVFPSNFRDIGYISFEKDKLESKSMDIIRELIGFGILKITT